MRYYKERTEHDFRDVGVDYNNNTGLINYSGLLIEFRPGGREDDFLLFWLIYCNGLSHWLHWFGMR